jgi:hypothetical protein
VIEGSPEGTVAQLGRLPLVVLALLAVPPIVAAQEHASSRATSVSEESIGASFNQLGLQHVLGVRWTRPLFRSASPLLADAHVSGGLAHTLTPSYMRVGAWVEAAPLSILGLRVGLEPGAYFGTFGSLAARSGYDDRSLSWPGSAGGPGSGGRVYLAPTVKMRLADFALASTGALEWWWSSAPGPFYYEPSRDTLLRSAGDRLLTVSTVLVRQVPQRDHGSLTYGVSYDLTLVPAAPGNRSQRLGVVVARRLASQRLGLQSPTVGLRVGYYLDDPQRQGQLTAAVGVSVERVR